MNFIEPYLAFYDTDFALQTVLARQPWPQRPGKHWFTDVRKLAQHDAQRNAYLWEKVAEDPQYRALTRRIWLRGASTPIPDDPTPAQMLKAENEQIERAVKAVAQLRCPRRQGAVRAPAERRPLSCLRGSALPARAGLGCAAARPPTRRDLLRGLPAAAGYYLPEWSHMTRAEAERFTAALYGIIERDFWGDGCRGDRRSRSPAAH